MKDITSELGKGSDTRAKAVVNNISLDIMLESQIKRALDNINLNKAIKYKVIDKDELVEKGRTTEEALREIVNYYAENFVVSIKYNIKDNLIGIHLGVPIARQFEEEDKEEF